MLNRDRGLSILASVLLICSAAAPASGAGPKPAASVRAPSPPARATGVVAATGGASVIRTPAPAATATTEANAVTGPTGVDIGHAEIGFLLAPKPIAGLTIDSRTIDVKSESSGEGVRPVGLLKGRYGIKGSALMCEQDSKVTRVKVSADSHFLLPVPLTAAKVKLRCFTVDAKGNAEEQNIVITFKGYAAFMAQNRAPSVKRFSFSPSLGYSLIQYTETGTLISLTLHALTAKVSATYLLVPPWLDIGGSIFGTALPLSVSGTTDTIRYLGFNFQAGFSITKIPEPWRFTVKLGGYYNQMFVSSGDFGYSPAICPSVTPVLRRGFGGGHAIYGYFKYVPVPLNQAFAFSADNREIGAGAGYSIPLSGGRSLSIALDFASLRIFSPVDPDVANSIASTIETKSYSASFGYGF